jgi:hypothetical protein
MRPGAAVLTPIFENIPRELKDLNQWVVWKDSTKKPFNPTALNSGASVKDPESWSSFEQAKVAYEEGELLGIGFVLNGNGIAGVDLDGCVIDGKPTAEALEVLQELGATYIEFSPSGTGLHAYGFADDLKSGVKVFYNNVNVELYTNKRYLTVTGRVFQSGSLAPFRNFTEFAKKVSKKATEVTEETKCNTSVSYVSSVSSVEDVDFPEKTAPKSLGQRNKALFALARYLKGINPNFTRQQLRYLVGKWHAKHLDVIGTKDLGTSWAEFQNAWENVKLPDGSTLKERLSVLPEVPESVDAGQYGLKAVHLFRICMALQRGSTESTFFLSCRMAGEQIGCHFTEAATLLHRFVKEGWLTLETESTPQKASRYKLPQVH